MSVVDVHEFSCEIVETEVKVQLAMSCNPPALATRYQPDCESPGAANFCDRISGRSVLASSSSGAPRQRSLNDFANLTGVPGREYTLT